ncbi:MAG: hypothetical protein ACRDTC_25650 [Pseudonocardiaceae bacterium]
MTDTHHGYVAGRYRNGALSDDWTDVTRCAERTFISYVARCRCGWLGNDYPPNPDGYNICRQELISNRLFLLIRDAVADQHHAATRRHLPVLKNPDLDHPSHTQ